MKNATARQAAPQQAAKQVAPDAANDNATPQGHVRSMLKDTNKSFLQDLGKSAQIGCHIAATIAPPMIAVMAIGAIGTWISRR